MAGQGPQTRQKMINLMYLVFIAMMALNVSQEVLKAFGMINEDLKQSISAKSSQNAAFMASLSEKVAEQPAEYKPLMKDAKKINQLADELTSFIEKLKKGALEDLGNVEGYTAMKSSAYFDNLFYSSGWMTPTAEKFVQKINNFREGVVSIIKDDYPQIAASVKKEFDTSPVTQGGVKKNFIEANYVGFPLVASLTQLSGIQADVKTAQSQVLSRMLQGQLIQAVSMTNYEALVIPDKTAFFSGENFTGKIVLGRVDKTMNFGKVVINGHEVSEENFKAGQVKLKFPAGNVGEQIIKGKLMFKEGDSTVTIPIKEKYYVIPKPNNAVISADKMNVVYRGVNNPMTISVPGVTNVSASAPGLRHVSGANYVMNPTNIKARKVNINVTATLPGGEPFSDSKTFRIEEIPRPVGTVRGQTMQGGPIRMQRDGLAISTISARIPNFDFDLNLVVTGFKMKVEGERTIAVHGQKLNSAAKRVLQNAERGSTVTIFDINAHIAGNSSYHLPPVSPILIQLTN